MRSMSRFVLLGALAAAASVPTAATAAPTASVKVSPNKGGTLTVGAPATFTAKLTGLARTPLGDGSQRIKAVVAKMPPSLLFNTIPFRECKTATFLQTKSCPSSTKLGTATIIADGGPDVGDITATSELYFGSGFAILARVRSNRPAVIDEAIIGSLRSSTTAGFGLEMYIPLSPILQQPLPGLFPTVKSVDATIKPFTKSVRVPGSSKKVKLPIAGLGPCPSNKKLPFSIGVVYTDSAGVLDTATDAASAFAKCKR